MEREALSWYVHITRAQRWGEGAQHPIPREQWFAYLESDQQMRRATPHDVEQNRPFVKADDGAWVEPWGDGNEKVLAWFGYHDGVIDVRSPHADTLRKMAQVAEKLKANVVDENDNVLVDPDAPEPTWRPPPAPPGKLDAATVAGIIGLTIVVLGLALVFWLLVLR